MRRRRPSSHVRRVRTKHGPRPTRINPQIAPQRHYRFMQGKFSEVDLARAAKKRFHELTDAEYAALEKAGYFTSARPRHFGATLLTKEDLTAATEDVEGALRELRGRDVRWGIPPSGPSYESSLLPYATDAERYDKARLERAEKWLRMQWGAAPVVRAPFFEKPDIKVKPLNPPKMETEAAHRKAIEQLEREARGKDPVAYEMAKLREKARRTAINEFTEQHDKIRVERDKLLTELDRREGVRPPQEDAPQMARLIVTTPPPKELALTDPDANFVLLSQALSTITPQMDAAERRRMANRLLQHVRQGPLHAADRKYLQARLDSLKDLARSEVA